MRNLDFSSWQTLLSTLLGLSIITLIGVGVRLLAMQTIQQRRERENRQINERLRTLISAYKTLGGSFTGNLLADPTHLSDLGRVTDDLPGTENEGAAALQRPSSERSRRIRDAVEAALSDIILLGTERQVQLAADAAAELAAGRPVETDELVICLREFIRKVLDLQPIPSRLRIPKQGPARAMLQKGSKDKDSDNTKQGSGTGGLGAGAGGSGLGASLVSDEDAHHE